MKFKDISNIIKYFAGGCFIFFILVTACEMGDSMNYSSDSGEGGSTARFTIVKDYMYVVDNKNLKVFKITDPTNPEMVKKVKIGFSIETIFSAEELLFVGSQFAMYIYDIKVPDDPVKLSETSHFYSCDPVVADERYAYVTLRSNSRCGWRNNELQIIDISDPENTEVVKTYDMDQPYGLAVRDNRLYICTRDEVVVYDKSDAPDLEFVYNINVDANDIIVLDSIFLLVTDRGIYEYSYTDTCAEKISSVYEIDD